LRDFRELALGSANFRFGSGELFGGAGLGTEGSRDRELRNRSEDKNEQRSPGNAEGSAIEHQLQPLNRLSTD
jgi:hypothetical protein